MRLFRHYFFHKKITIAKWKFNLFGVFCISLGLIGGIYLTVSNFVIPKLFATVATSVSKDTDAHFNQGSFTDVEVSGSGTSAYLQMQGGAGPGGDDWYNGSWQYRKKITIDNSDQSDDLVNFPILIELDSGTDIDYDKTEDAGEDIRFTDSNGTTLLPYDIEEWDETGISYVWVKVPQINGSSDTDYIYIYYGNDSVSDAQDSADVWDDYAMVYHLNEDSGTTGAGSVDDSTDNTSGTPSGGISFGQSGKLASSTDFSSGTGISCGTVGSSILTAASSISFWINTTNYASPSRQNPFEQAYGGWGTMTIETSSRISWFFGSNGGNSSPYGSHQSSNLMANGSWIHVTAVRNPSDHTYKWYKDGSFLSGSGYSASYPVINDRTFTIGDGYVRPLNGKMDEFRVANFVQTPDWISATHRFENDNDTYVSFATEQTSLPPSGTWESPTDSNVIDIIYNGGWGDGTGSSTGFSATVADVGANSSITFSMRSAATAVGLSSASYADLGTASSGTTFTRTKTQLDALSIDTGTDGRYIQVRATLASSDGIANPKLDNFTIYYLADNTPPEVNATSLVMQDQLGGTTLTSNAWTSGSEPYFSWTAGSDSESGIKGYCLYLGQDGTANPATSKGLLGTSPTSTTGTTCQFIITATSLDLATEAYRGNTWISSSADPYYLNIRAVDKANNVVTASSLQFQFRFDNTPPENSAGLSSPQGYQRSLDSFTIAWAGSGSKGPSDSHSGIKGYQYKIEDGIWQGDSHSGAQNCSDVLSDNVYTLDATYDSLATGESTFYLRTWDNACNVATTTISAILKYNSDAPAAPEDLTVIPETNTANSFSFTWNVPAEFNGSASGLSYCYTINTLPSASTCTWTSDTSLAADAYANQPGENTFYISAKDEAGNVNYADYSTVNFTADTPAPGVPVNVDVADISVKATSNWKLVFSWESPTNTGVGISYYKIFRSTTNTTCTANFSSFTEEGTTSGTSYADTGLIQQTYYYCAKACDSANNCSAVSSTYSGFPDGKYTEAAELTSGPSAGGITTKRARISWSTDRTCDSKVQYRKSSSDDYYDEEPSNSEHVTDHEINLTSLDPGTRYYYRAKWTDEDGNTGTSDEKSFKTDPAPTVKDVEAKNVGISSAIIELTTKGASSVKIYYGQSTDFGGLKEIATSIAESTYTAELSGLLDGTKYYYKINLFDEEEDEYEGTILDFETLPRPRISDVKIQQVKGTAQPTVYITWTSNTDISSIVTYYPEGNAADTRDEVNVELISGNHSMVIRGLIPQTKYTLIVKGRDKIGNEAESDAHSFTTATDTRPPQISNLTVEGASIPPTKREGEINIQLLVSWDTDEPATSQVEYGEGTGTTYSQKTQEDSNSTFNHMVIISGLTPSKVYHLRAISKDEADNTSKSIDTVTISPKATDSAFDLVIGNLQELFGFVLKGGQ